MNIARRENGSYRARFRDAAGKEHSKSFGRRADAVRWLADQKAKVDRGEWNDPALGRITMREWAPTWIASKASLKPTTRRDYQQVWRTQVEPRWGDVPLARITYAEIVIWVSEMTARGISPSWTRQALLCLNQMLELAVRDGRVARNVAKLVAAPRVRRGEQRFLGHAELRALADECGRRDDQYRLLVLLLGYTGLRFGEVRALRVLRLDLLRARLEVAENIPDGFDEADTVAPKSHKRRVVPYPRFLVDGLACHVAGKQPTHRVFTNTASGLLDNSNFRRNMFDPAVRALGLAPFTPHNLRDTAASLAVSAGANVKAVQRMLGHASAAMTLDVYAGLFSDDLDRVAERLNEAALADSAATVRPSPPTITSLPHRR